MRTDLYFSVDCSAISFRCWVRRFKKKCDAIKSLSSPTKCSTYTINNAYNNFHQFQINQWNVNKWLGIFGSEKSKFRGNFHKFHYITRCFQVFSPKMQINRPFVLNYSKYLKFERFFLLFTRDLYWRLFSISLFLFNLNFIRKVYLWNSFADSKIILFAIRFDVLTIIVSLVFLFFLLFVF